jgi:hypothetical protein
VVEVGFETAERWSLVHHLGGRPWYDVHQWVVDNVLVYIGQQPPQRGMYPTFYAEWFLALTEED